MTNHSTSGAYGFHYHLVPPTGLINDPNGLIFWRNQFHVFFQWNPTAPNHQTKHWGHLVSDDLISWRRLPVALESDESYDKNGVYSGSAIDRGNELWLYYTGNVKDEHDVRTSYQCLAVSKDGIHFEKRGPLFEHPAGYTAHVRDPKVWFDERVNHYWLLLGAQREDLTGDTIIYASRDLVNWELKGSLVEQTQAFGYMWECPDVVQLDGKDVFIYSPQGIDAEGDRFQNIFQTVYQLGEFTRDGKFVCDTPNEVVECDAGFEYYAPQSFQMPDGRVIQYAWMGTMPPEKEAAMPTVAEGWIHALTIPRELSYHDGVFYQRPARELYQLRTTEMRQYIKQASTTVKLPSLQQNIVCQWEEDAEDVQFMLRDEVLVQYTAETRTLTVTRTDWVSGEREQRSRQLQQPLRKLEWFIEQSSVELFVNDGATVFSLRYFATPDAPQQLAIDREGEQMFQYLGHSLNAEPFISE